MRGYVLAQTSLLHGCKMMLEQAAYAAKLAQQISAIDRAMFDPASAEPALDENGTPILSTKGKPVLKKAYSVLQDDFFRYMRDAGYNDVERGERGSSEEHLTVTQFKVQQEQARLAELTEQNRQQEQQAATLGRQIEKIQNQQVNVAAIEKIEAKSVPFSSKVAVEREDFEHMSTLAKKYVVAEKKESKLQKAVDAPAVELPRGKNGKGKGGKTPRVDAKALQAWQSFAKELFPTLAGQPIAVVGDGFLLEPPALLPAAKLHVLRAGVPAGRAAKGRFEPAHALFMAYGAQCTNCEELTLADPRTAAWLRGEEIEAKTAQNGWCAVLVDGFPLGGGKASGGRIKNHYPKALRNLK